MGGLIDKSNASSKPRRISGGREERFGLLQDVTELTSTSTQSHTQTDGAQSLAR